VTAPLIATGAGTDLAGWRPGHGHAADTDYAPTPRMDKIRLPDQEVQRVRDVVALSGLVPFFEGLLARPTDGLPDGTTRRRAGRPCRDITVEGVLVALVCLAAENKPLLLNHVADVLHHRLSPAMRSTLGISRRIPYLVPDQARSTKAQKTRERSEGDTADRQVERFVQRMLTPIDPSPLPKNRVLDRADHDRKIKTMTPRDIAERQVLLEWASNRLLEATWLSLLRNVRRAWKGSLGHDATWVGAWSEGRGKDDPKRPADPDAGYYGRKGDHAPSDGFDPTERESDGTKKWKFGYELELAVVGADCVEDERKYPFLILGMNAHRPGEDPGGNCIRVLTDISRRHLLANPVTGQRLPEGTHPDPDPQPHPTMWLAADRAYSYAKMETWALPARALGYAVVVDYGEGDLGVQGSHAGMILVEGGWYSPGMPKSLRDATKDRRAKRISEETYRTRIKERANYRMRVREREYDKTTGKPTGKVKYACPAAGTAGGKHAPSVKCDAKPDSLVTIGLLDGRLRVGPPKVAGAVPTICAQQTVDVAVTVEPKHQQDLAFESPEWCAVYHPLRNTIEGRNNQVKDPAFQGIASAQRRRVRGIAAVTFLSAVMLAADNMRRINEFYATADWHPDGSMTVREPPKTPAKVVNLQSFLPQLLPGPDDTPASGDSVETGIPDRTGRNKRRVTPK